MNSQLPPSAILLNQRPLVRAAWAKGRFFRCLTTTALASLCVLAAARADTITVNSTADPAGFNSAITIAQLGATVTLRDAVNAAANTPGDHTIQFAAALAPDGTRIVAGHSDGHVRIFDTATGALVQALEHPGTIKSLRFAPGASGRFLSASNDGSVRVWNLATGAQVHTIAAHRQAIIATAWSPDARFIATASYDTTARVWDAATGRPIGAPMPHLAWLSHLEFSPDGQRLATACRDGTVRLWHPRTGAPASPPRQQGATGHTVRFTADSAAFLVRDHDGFRFWDTASAEPVSLHFREPLAGGLGMDSADKRAIMTADGTAVFLGASMPHSAHWPIAQPRAAAPPWLPDFLEMLAQMRLDERGEIQLVPRDAVRRFQSGGDDPYAVWVRGILGLEAM